MNAQHPVQAEKPDSFLAAGLRKMRLAVEHFSGRIADLRRRLATRHAMRWTSYLWGVLVVVLCTAVSRIMFTFPYFALDNIIIIYMLGIVVVAVRYGQGPAILSSVLTVIAINVFFVPHYLTAMLAGVKNLITFAAMLLIAIVTGSLAVRIKQQAEAARQGEQRAAALYALSGELASTVDTRDLVRVAEQHIGDVFNSHVAIMLTDPDHRVQVAGNGVLAAELNHFVPGGARWTPDSREMASLGTAQFPESDSLYVTLVAARGTVGVLNLRPRDPIHPLTREQSHLLRTFANQTALAIERARLAEEAQQARVQIETEQLRNALLSSVSHDLRTPLTAITGATTLLLDDAESIDSVTRHELIQSVYEEADRLNRLVRNLLDMTRLESGSVQVHKEWQLIEDVVGSALTRLDKQLAGRQVTAHLPAALPLVPLDDALIEQVLLNLLENASKYTPPSSPIDIAAHVSGTELVVEVSDCGPGIVPGDHARIFEKFYRAAQYRAESSGRERGVGLGLTICRGIVDAHGGRIWAEDRPGGGAVFCFTLPLGSRPPEVEALAEDECEGQE